LSYICLINHSSNIVSLFPSHRRHRHAAELTLAAKCGTLALFELHHFKNLQHLSLQFREGNDAAIKKYLADRLIDTKARARHLDAELAAQNEAGAAQTLELAALRDDAWAAREQHASAVANLKAAHALELADARQVGSKH
jgi:hypothetical protein